ncbi:MAG: SH3 domain-containing protein, partial [Bacillota bacterium]
MNSSRKSLRLVALAMCMALLFGLAAPAMAASIYAYGTVNANNTPVYSSTAKTATLGVFNLGDVVAIESQVSAQNLYVVRLGASTTSVGYIAKSAVGSVTTSLKSGTAVATVKTSGTSTGSAGVIANCTTCNFRAAASNSSTKLGTLNKGTAVTVLATEGSFYKIVANNTTGYVSKTYVTITNTSGTGTTTSGTAGVIANCNSYVNFRATASATGTLLGTLSKGTTVTVIATEGSF